MKDDDDLQQLIFLLRGIRSTLLQRTIERVRYIDIENSFASIMHLPSNARLFPRILVC